MKTVRVAVDRASFGVGDEITYTVEVQAASDQQLRVSVETGPLTRLGPAHAVRDHQSGISTLRVEETLACLDTRCLPGHAARTLQLPSVRVFVGSRMSIVPGPRVTVVPRVSESAVIATRPPFQYERLTPSPLGGGTAAALLVAAAVLVSAALIVLALELRRGRRQIRAASTPRTPDLHAAARYLRQSASRPEGDRRRAADFAARALGRVGSEQSEAATRVAWDTGPPQPDELYALADSVTTELAE